MFRLRFVLFFFIFSGSLSLFAQQKVGLVLSGGGAAGLVHVGVIKALEENNIPVHCVAGTSMGAFVASMYASGFSPEKMIKLVTSENFRSEARGIINDKYSYYFKRKDDNASWINFKFSPDTVITTSLPTNLISPIPIDFGLLEGYTTISAVANYNFDSLFIPFRCIAADVAGKKQVIFRSGHLNEAVRASMSYPFYLRPVNYNGKLLYDGGIYNNFPADVLQNDFRPDFIIGSNVSGNAREPDEDNIVSQIKAMLLGKTAYEVTGTDHIIISPDVKDVGTFEFENIEAIIEAGYLATIQMMDSIKKSVTTRVSKAELEARRAEFLKKQPEFLIENIYIEGLNKYQAGYVRKLLSITPDKKTKAISIASLKPQYFRLVADEKIKHIYPLAKLNSNGKFDLFLKIKKEKKLAADIGGNFSSRPISVGYVGLQYNYLRRQAISVYTNFYFGRLYSSFLGGARMDFANKVPFSVEAIVTGARWDYFKSNVAFFEDEKPSYLISNETHGELNFLLPAYNKGKFRFGIAESNITSNYYQSLVYFKSDTADKNNFTFSSAHMSYTRNTLNRKQYANSGSLFDVNVKYVYGEEKNYPGNTSNKKEINTIYGYYRKYHQWIQAKLTYDNYLKGRGRLRFGVFGEAVVSTQEFFANYTATMLVSPAFQPIPESKTLFLANFRANQYVAGGLKTLISMPFNLDIRLEGYLFQPYYTILKTTTNDKAEYSLPFEFRTFMASSAIVYNTPIGPAAFSVNYYDKFTNHNSNFSFLFTFGYIIFNKKVLE